MANISEISIRRPVLSTVMMLVVILFGVIGYTFLGVREYPSVDQPIITVTASYPGANAEVIMNQITEPLEQNINGIPGIRSLSSTSSQGQSRITVESTGRRMLISDMLAISGSLPFSGSRSVLSSRCAAASPRW